MLNHYWFWLIVVSLLPLILERIWPWRTGQRLFRPQWVQDVFWLFFNGYGLALVVGPVFVFIYTHLDGFFVMLAGRSSGGFRVLAGQPFWVQVVALLVVADFLEWSVHNLLHRVNFLWSFHRLHHSITTMDWIGNFRFHWMEIFVYKTIKYLPLSLLGGHWQAVLVTAVISTLVGNFNHANLKISWGPLRYIFNSPVMHLWHHDKYPRNRAGYNFAIVFSAWDWLFGTAWMPPGQTPKALGFYHDSHFPRDLIRRFFVPFLDLRSSADNNPPKDLSEGQMR